MSDSTTWTTSKIEEISASTPRSIAIGPFGSALKSDEYTDSGVPVVRGQDILEGRIIASDGLVYVSEATAARFPACIARKGDLVFPHRGAIGRVGIVGDDDLLLSSSMMKLTCDTCVVDPMYVFYYFRGPGRNELLARASTVGTPGIGQPLSSLRSIPISYPSLEEQRTIAEVLGTLDDKIAANIRILSIAEALSDVLFESAVRELGTTERRTIRELAGDKLLAYGDGYRTKRSEHGQPGLRIIRAGDIQGGHIVPGGEDFVSDAHANQVGEKICRPGDIVLTTKGTVGRVAVVADGIDRSVYSPQLCYFRVAEAATWIQPWLAAWFRSIDRVRQTDIAMHKSDMAPYVNLQDIGSLAVPVPERGQIGAVTEQLDSLLKLGHGIATESSVLARTRDELLPLLMSGRLRVRDAEKKVEELV